MDSFPIARGPVCPCITSYVTFNVTHGHTGAHITQSRALNVTVLTSFLNQFLEMLERIFEHFFDGDGEALRLR